MGKKLCTGCGEIKPLTSEYWAYRDKAHTSFRSKCRKCTNRDSTDSHSVAREKVKESNITPGAYGINIAYIKKLAKWFRIAKPDELFIAMVLFETSELVSDIEATTEDDVKWIYENYREYLTGREEPLVNPRWLRR